MVYVYSFFLLSGKKKHNNTQPIQTQSINYLKGENKITKTGLTKMGGGKGSRGKGGGSKTQIGYVRQIPKFLAKMGVTDEKDKCAAKREGGKEDYIGDDIDPGMDSEEERVKTESFKEFIKNNEVDYNKLDPELQEIYNKIKEEEAEKTRLEKEQSLTSSKSAVKDGLRFDSKRKGAPETEQKKLKKKKSKATKTGALSFNDDED